MNAHNPIVKPPRDHAILKNMTALLAATHRLIDRPQGTDAFGVMYGETGLGKTYSTLFVRKETDAVLVQIGRSFTIKSLLCAILTECGIPKPRGTVSSLTDEVILQLGEQRRRPLIIDEAHMLVDKGLIEYCREWHDKAGVPVLLVGEEILPKRMEAIPRVHGRVTEWVEAMPCDLGDCRKLVNVFVPNAAVDDALLARVQAECGYRVRLIVNTLHKMSLYARNTGLTALDLGNYRGEIFTGKTPPRTPFRPQAEGRL